MSIVAFDLDDVILNLREGFHAALARRFGPTYPHWSAWRDLWHFKPFGCDLHQFLSVIVEERLLEQAPIEPGAWSAIMQIRAMGFETAVVTARGYHPYGVQVTVEWLHRNAVDMDHVVIVPFGESKADAIRSLGRVVAYVDDHSPHLQGLRAAGVGGQLALMDRPWNQLTAAYPRVHDLHGFARLVEMVVPQAA